MMLINGTSATLMNTMAFFMFMNMPPMRHMFNMLFVRMASLFHMLSFFYTLYAEFFLVGKMKIGQMTASFYIFAPLQSFFMSMSTMVHLFVMMFLIFMAFNMSAFFIKTHFFVAG